MKVFDSKSFGEALRQQRKHLGYTQNDVAQHCGFSISFISDLENGKSTAELGKAIYLANMLGLDIVINARGSK